MSVSLPRPAAGVFHKSAPGRSACRHRSGLFHSFRQEKIHTLVENLLKIDREAAHARIRVEKQAVFHRFPRVFHTSCSAFSSPFTRFSTPSTGPEKKTLIKDFHKSVTQG